MEKKEGRSEQLRASTTLVTRLSDELLFTLENVERQAYSLKQQSWLPKSRRQTLDQMLEDTKRMNGLLRELMDTIKPELGE